MSTPDEVAKREEERLSKALNRTGPARRPSWSQRQSGILQPINTGAVKTTITPVQSVSTSQPSTSSSSGENWKQKREREERERKEQMERERKLKEEKIKGIQLGTANEDVHEDGKKLEKTAGQMEELLDTLSQQQKNEKKPTTTQPVVTKPQTQETKKDQRSSARLNLDEVDSLISSMENIGTKKESAPPQPRTTTPVTTNPSLIPPPENKVNSKTFDELEDILSSLDKPVSQTTSKPPVYETKPRTSTSNTPLDELDAIINPTRPTSQLYNQPVKNVTQDSDIPSAYKMVTPTDKDVCGRCGDGFSSSDKIFAMGLKWHKDHFTCYSCQKPLTDTFVPRERQPYCEDCYKQTLVCLKCGLPITGTHIDAKGKLFHVECAGGESCARCSKPINDVSIQAAEKMWHQECFTCANCKKRLHDTYVRKSGDVWCKECYDREMLCDKCAKPLSSQYVTTKGKKFHSECFCCGLCRKELGSNYFDVNGTYQCESCYQSAVGYCATCNRPLTGQFVKCLEKKYHENCFVCYKCKNKLEEDFYNVGNNPHCFACASANNR